MQSGTGIEMAEVIPEIGNRFDIPELVQCVAPRHLMIVSATDDKYSKDADRIVDESQETFASLGVAAHLEHRRYDGGHALCQERFADIIEWTIGVSNRV